MKTIITSFGFLTAIIFNQTAFAQTKRFSASAGRSEYIEVERNVKLHVTDLGTGRAVVLIHGWPLSDDMYEYQYQYLVKSGFRVIGANGCFPMCLRGSRFGR